MMDTEKTGPFSRGRGTVLLERATLKRRYTMELRTRILPKLNKKN